MTMTRMRLLFLPLLLLVAGLGFAVFAGFYAAHSNREYLEEAFAAAVARTQNQIVERMQIYERGLYSIRGTVAVTDGLINRRQFRAYAESRDYFAEQYPGARGFGLIRRVPPAQEAAFTARARADDRPDFTIRHLAAHDEDRFVIQYIEPDANNWQAAGLDIGSEPKRRSTALLAARTGTMAMTPPLTLVQADGKPNRGFLILLSLAPPNLLVTTEDEREQATDAWVYAPLVIDEVLSGLDFIDDVALRLHDITDRNDIQNFYTESDFPDVVLAGMEARSTLPIGGRLWQVEIRGRPSLIKNQTRYSPLGIGLFFAALPMALAWALYLVLRNNAMAVEADVKEQQSQELIEATALRKAIHENAGYALITTNTDGIITSFNPAAEAMLGYRAADMIGKANPGIFHDPQEIAAQAAILSQELGREYPPGFGVFIERTLSGKPDSQEWTYIRRDGTRVPVWLTVTALTDERGKIFGFLGIAADLTKRKESDERFRRVIDMAPTPILLCDLSGNILNANKAADHTFGYAPAELTGQSVAVLIPSAARPGHAAFVQAYIENPSPRPMGSGRRLTALRRDGSEFPVEVALSPILLEKDSMVMVLILDISEREQYTRELENAKRAAENAARAKSEFLANMSHEIRTPMNAIMGLTQLVLESHLDERQADYLHKVRNASQTLLGILNDILDLSKIDAGQLTLEQREFRLEEIVEASIGLFSLEAARKGLELILEFDPGLPVNVTGDSLRLSQILNNLLGNAIKFTEQGYIHVKVQALHMTEESLLIEFSVRDTGIGLAPEQADKLFRPFTQADASTTRKHGGTGLGLAICKRLVEMMDGAIHVESEINTGSTFTFTAKFAPGTPVAARDLHHLAGLRTLIVDDHDFLRSIMVEQLRKWQITADEACNGEEAMKMLHGKTYDLVLLDWQMPVMDGIELARQVAVTEFPGGTRPLLVMNSAQRRETVEAALGDVHMDAIIPKPVTPSHLFDTLMNLRRPGARKVNTASPDYQLAALPLVGATVLLAEDNPINQQVARSFLNRAGLCVDIAGNGREAVEMATARHYAAILMDMQMPEMDGLEATRTLRATRGCEALPIIAMTANAMSQDREQCIEAGMNDHIAKPIVPLQMIEVLLKWVLPGNGRRADTTATQIQGIRPPTALELSQLREQLAQLAADLEARRLKAKQQIAPIETLLADTTLAAAFADVAQSVRELRFAQASADLEYFLERINTSLS